MKREDLKTYAKFRATCERCGKRSPVRTSYTVGYWMDNHEKEHKIADLTEAS